MATQNLLNPHPSLSIPRGAAHAARPSMILFMTIVYRRTRQEAVTEPPCVSMRTDANRRLRTLSPALSQLHSCANKNNPQLPIVRRRRRQRLIDAKIKSVSPFPFPTARHVIIPRPRKCLRTQSMLPYANIHRDRPQLLNLSLRHIHVNRQTLPSPPTGKRQRKLPRTPSPAAVFQHI